MKYNHTQVNKIGIALVLVVSVFSIMSTMAEHYEEYVPQWINTAGWNIWGAVIVGLIYLLLLNMMVLRINVSKTEIIWRFGIGIPTKRIPLEEITSLEMVTNKWWYGWGVRKLLSGGWLYNVFGLQAIEIKTKHGKIVRLGTDEPKKLYRVLDSMVSLDSNEADHG